MDQTSSQLQGNFHSEEWYYESPLIGSDFCNLQLSCSLLSSIWSGIGWYSLVITCELYQYSKSDVGNQILGRWLFRSEQQ